MPEADTTPSSDPVEDPATTAGEGNDALKSALDKERDLHKGARTALRTAEEERDALAAKVRAFEQRDLSDGEKQQQALAAAQQAEADAITQRDEALLELRRYKVGTSIEGFPPSLIPRLRGDTEEEMTEDAKALMGSLGESAKSRKPAPDPGLGRAKGGGTSTADQFTSAVSQLL